MAITDGKCCGIIHVLERRQSRRRGRWGVGEGGTTREHDRGVKNGRCVWSEREAREPLVGPLGGKEGKKSMCTGVFPVGWLQMWTPYE